MAVGAVGDVGVVGGDDDGGAAVGFGPEQVEDALAVGAVEFTRGLVSQDHPAPLGDAASDRDPLLFTSGEFLDQVVAAVLEPDLGEGGLDRPVELAPRSSSPAGLRSASNGIDRFSRAVSTRASPLPCGNQYDAVRAAAGRSVMSSPSIST